MIFKNHCALVGGVRGVWQKTKILHNFFPHLSLSEFNITQCFRKFLIKGYFVPIKFFLLSPNVQFYGDIKRYWQNIMWVGDSLGVYDYTFFSLGKGQPPNWAHTKCPLNYWSALFAIWIFAAFSLWAISLLKGGSGKNLICIIGCLLGGGQVMLVDFLRAKLDGKWPKTAISQRRKYFSERERDISIWQNVWFLRS